jgi:hypothetical protein
MLSTYTAHIKRSRLDTSNVVIVSRLMYCLNNVSKIPHIVLMTHGPGTHCNGTDRA